MPVDYTDPQVLEVMSYRAKEWAAYLQENQLQNLETARAIAFKRVQEVGIDILIRNLEKAIKDTKEYDIPELSAPLIDNFKNPEILAAPEGIIEIHADEFGGTWADFYDGVKAARKVLKVDEGKDIARRAAFWKVFVYQPAREGTIPPAKRKETAIRKQHRAINTYYPRVVNVRLGFWFGKTPYWHWLENGNYHKRYRYPQFAATHFVDNTRRQLQKVYDRELEQVDREMETALDRGLEQFLIDPENFEPNQVLGEFYNEGRRYKVYITPARHLVGVIQR